MKHREMKGAYGIAFSAMMAALSVIFLFLSAVLPAGRLVMYFLSSIFIAPLAYGQAPKYAVGCFLSAALIGFFLLPNKLGIVPYVLFFGHYGLGKYYIEKITRKSLGFILKYLYFNICITLCYLLAKEVLLADISAEISLWVIALAAQVVFLIFDFAYSLVLDIYYKRILK
ncbi:MAG: hypothetical protein ACOYJC_05215 [Christensenellales bacterium]|jgi:hypothetical protein